METFDATPNPEVSEHAQETPRTPGQNWDHFSQVMRDYSILNHIPYKASFELTARCSLKCKMCLMRLDPEQLPEYGRELTAAEWIRLGEMAFNAGTLDLLL
ncbi:MAG: hypothetical protein LBK46_04550, partial [Oscillospiraceae bacterium]|nr:hypothetical protein [Oscillospiraceae bacterium]